MSRLQKSVRSWRPRLLAALALVSAFAAVGFIQDTRATQIQESDTTVAIVRASVENPNDTQIDTLVREAVALAGGLPSGIVAGKKVMIQPNLVESTWTCGSGIVTNKQVVRTVVQMLLERGVARANIFIGEGTAAGDGRNSTETAFKNAGYDVSPQNMIDDVTLVQLVDYNEAGGTQPNYRRSTTGPYNTAYVTKVTLTSPLLDSAYWIKNELYNADYVIACPVLKNHSLAGITGALKLGVGVAPADIYHYPDMNIYKWGLVHDTWNRSYTELETNARSFVDMVRCKPFCFVVTDGLVGITNGPTGTNQCSPKLKLILAGADPLAVDTIQCLIMSYDPASIPSLTHAYNTGLGTKNVGRITVKGLHVKDVRYTFPLWGCASRCDLTSPTMSGLNIPNGAVVCGTIHVKPLDPADNSALSKGELYVDGPLYAYNRFSPYGIDLDTSGLSPGSHTITYTLYDGALNEVSATRTITVANGPAIKTALYQSDGTPVALGGVVVSGLSPTLGGSVFFVQSQDNSSGLRVHLTSGTPSLADGDVVSIWGTMTTVNGQRVLSCTGYQKTGTTASRKAATLANRAVGGAGLCAQTPGVWSSLFGAQGQGVYNLGLLIRISGRVYYDGGDTYVDDGTVADNGAGKRGVRIALGSLPRPASGSYIVVTGHSCCELIGGRRIPVVVPRASADISTP